MKQFGLLLALVLGSGATAQTLVSPAVGLGVAYKLRPKAPLGNPLEPSGFDGLPPREGTLPPPRPVGDEEKELRIEWGKWTNKGSRVKAVGGVHAIYKGYDLFGSELDGDTKENIFTLRGDVKVIGKDAVVTGQTVTINFNDDSFKAIDGDAQLSPTVVGGRLLDDVYLRGGESYGSRREVWGNFCSLTTCNLDHPHFHIDSKSTDIRPGKRMILRDVRIKLLDRELLRLPYLSIPLEDRSDKYLPEVGQSQDEGYYIKFKYPVPLKGSNNLLNARLDYFTKLGNGFGADYFYESRVMQGYLKAYGLVGNQRTFAIDQSHEMRLGDVTLNVQNNLQRANYLTSPQNTTLNSRVGLNWIQRNGAATAFSFYRTSNESDDFKSVFQTIALNDNRSIGRSTRTSLDLTMSDSLSSFTGSNDIKRSQLDVRFRGTQDLVKATAELEYQRSIPIGDTTNFFGSPDRTPVLSLRSDGSKLLGRRWGEELPMQAEVSVGEYGNASAGDGQERISRGSIELGISRPDRSQRRYGVDMDLRYRQGIYSDDTAQYTIGYNGSARYRLGRRTGINIRYNLLEAHGYTPLQFDRTGRSNIGSADISFEPMRRVLIGAQTGYDFIQEELGETAWQSIGTRFEWNPTDSVQFRALNTYDTFSKAWSNVRLDFAWKAGATFISAGARYDGIRHTWGNVNFYVDGFKMGRLKTSALFIYNGYSRQFEARHYSFTYDLHCAEAIFQVIDTPIGFRPGTQFGFFIRLKALPFNTPFGLGRSGQSFGTGTGRDGF